MLAGCGAEKDKEVYDEEEQTLLYHKVDIALDFGMYGLPTLTHVARNMLDKKETYENVFLYAGMDLADAAIERGREVILQASRFGEALWICPFIFCQ